MFVRLGSVHGDVAWGAVLVACSVALVGCASSDRDRAWIARALEGRGVTAGGEDALERLEDGADEDDVIALALAHSPTYRADLARIDAARADLDEAGRPVNPQLTLAGALGPISAFATLFAPIESLWQIPLRTEAAARALESVAESLVQSGLDLARDARLAHAERGLAEDRVRIRTELAALLAELARIADARVRLGDASPAESAVVLAEATAVRDLLQTNESELAIARARLRQVLGLEASVPDFAIAFTRAPGAPPELAALLALARGSRPDARAAEIAIRAAAGRAGWERSRVLALGLHVEGHWQEPSMPSLRIGGRIELPIFSQNQGGIGRADAEVLRADALLVATQQRIAFEIVSARTRAAQAQASLATYRETVLPALEEALRVATRAYEIGEETYLIVIDVLRRIGEARLREAELVAESRRADAELERAVGARIGASQ